MAANTILSVLIIGGSHLASPGYLISTLHDELAVRGLAVHTIGICGVQPSHWVRAVPLTCGAAERKGKSAPQFFLGTKGGKTLNQLVAESSPSWVVVVMGDTFGGYKGSIDSEWVVGEITQLTREIDRLKLKCAWVGPTWGHARGPYGKTDEGVKRISKFLSENTKPCQYIDSLPMSKPGEWGVFWDGQHLTNKGYQLWGSSIAKELIKIW